MKSISCDIVLRWMLQDLTDGYWTMVQVMSQCWPTSVSSYGPLTRYVTLRVAHAPGMPGTFSPTADVKGNRKLEIPARASRTCHDACRDRLPASLRGKRSRHSRRMRTHSFTYLARGPWHHYAVISYMIILFGRRMRSWHGNTFPEGTSVPPHMLKASNGELQLCLWF